jgi:5-methylcytosine-specific restriction endonuclease McrA
MIKVSQNTPFDHLCGMQCVVGSQRCPAYDVCPLNKILITGIFKRFTNCCQRELNKGNHISLAYNDLEKMVRWNILQGFRCPVCGETMEINNGQSDSMLIYTVEHVKPMGKGGSNTIDNIIICCRKCNYKNNEKDIAEGNKNNEKEL